MQHTKCHVMISRPIKSLKKGKLRIILCFTAIYYSQSSLAVSQAFASSCSVSGGTIDISGCEHPVDGIVTPTSSPDQTVIGSDGQQHPKNVLLAKVPSLNGEGNVLLGENRLLIGRDDGVTDGTVGIFSGSISGQHGGINVYNNQTLTGNNTYTGETHINSGGSLSISGNGSIASSSGVVFSPDGFNKTSTLDISGANGNVDISNIENGTNISGQISGVGNIVLGHNNLNITKAHGALVAGDISGESGSMLNVSGERLVLGSGSTGVMNSAAGLSVANSGSGGVDLNGINNYTGDTIIKNGGRLYVYGSIGGSTNIVVQNGGTLRGFGPIGAGNGTEIRIEQGGTISPGSDGQTRQAMTLNGNVTIDGTADLAEVSGNGSGKQSHGSITVNGNLTLNGKLETTDRSAQFGSGVQRLFQYSGTLNNNTTLLVDGIEKNKTGYLQSKNGQINLIATQGGDRLSFWNGSGTAVNGGSGTWGQGTGVNWTNSSGETNSLWHDKDYAVFQNNSGTVTVDGNVSVTGMQFASSGYMLVPADSGSGITLSGKQYDNPNFAITSTGSRDDQQKTGKLFNGSGLISTIRVGDGTAYGDNNTAIIQTSLTDAAGQPTTLVKTDSGTLVLSGTNSYQGGTVVTDGRLEITSDRALGAASTDVALDGGTLKIGADIENSSRRQIILSSNGGTIDLDGHHYKPGGSIIGQGSLLISSSETSNVAAGVPANGTDSVIDLDHDNTYTGNTTIIGLGGTPSSPAATTVVINADNNTPFGENDTHKTVSVSQGAVVNMNGNPADGPNASASLGSHTLNITDSTINFNNKSTADRSNIYLANSVINYNDSSSAGASKLTTSSNGDASGIVNFNGSSTAGTASFDMHRSTSQLIFNDNSNAGKSYINIADSASVTFKGNSDAGSGKITNWNSNISFSDHATADHVEIENHGHIDISTLQTDGINIGRIYGDNEQINLGNKTLSFSDGSDINGAIKDGGDAGGVGGSIRKYGTGLAILEGNNTYTGKTIIDAGTLQLGNENPYNHSHTDGQLNGTSGIENNGILAVNNINKTTLSNISGSGSVLQEGQGTTVLTGSNSYTGVTGITNGVLQLGNGHTDGQLNGTSGIENNGILAVDNINKTTLSNISGSGSVLQKGQGTTVLTGSNSYTGVTGITNGVLQLGDGHMDGQLNGTSGIENNGILAVNNINKTILRNISGSGSVLQKGQGTTVLAENNNYTGKTDITNGVLQLGDGENASNDGKLSGETVINISEAGTFGIRNVGDTLISDKPQITGTGTLLIAGIGNTVIEGDKSGFTGTTIIDAGLPHDGGDNTDENIAQKYGVFEVNSNMGNATIEARKGTLAGIGQVGDVDVHANGAIAPGKNFGHQTGTLTINGDLHQESGSSYFVSVDPQSKEGLLPDGKADMLQVQGVAKIDSGANMVVRRTDALGYITGTRYEVLSAKDGIEGSYTLKGDISDDTSGDGGANVSAFKKLIMETDDHNIWLNTVQYRAFTDAAQTHNEKEVSRAFQQMVDQGINKPMINYIDSLQTDKDARVAFNANSGEVNASVKSLMFENSVFLRTGMVDRLEAAECFSPSGDIKVKNKFGRDKKTCGEPGANFWMSSYGGWGGISSDGNASGIHESGAGFIMGVDSYIRNTNWVIGGTVGYGHGTMSDKLNTTGRSNDIAIGIYSGTHWGNLGLRVGIGYTWALLSGTRRIRFAGFYDSVSAGYQGGTGQGFVDLGYKFHLPYKTIIEPFGNFAYVHVNTDKFKEHGNIWVLMSGRASNQSVSYSTFGIRASSNIKLGSAVLVPYGAFMFRHAFGDLTPSVHKSFVISGGDMNIKGITLAEDMFAMDAGLKAKITDRLSVGLGYNGHFGARYHSSGIHGSFSWKF